MRILTTLSMSILLAACGAGGQQGPDTSDTRTAAPSQAAPAKAELAYDVFTGDAKGFFVTSTLITAGDRAVLIDGQFTVTNGRKLAAWIADKNVTLETVFITHAHPDHYFGLGEVMARFPKARIVATPEVIRHMEELGPKKLAYWGPIYKEDMPKELVKAAPLSADSIRLASHRLNIVAVPQADAAPATVVHVPSLSLVVAGDLAYGGVHPWLADAPTAAQRDAWVASIRTVQKLAPRSVVAGHKAPGTGDPASVLEDTADYIAAFGQLRAASKTPAELEAALAKRYPTHALPIISKLASQAAFAPEKTH